MSQKAWFITGITSGLGRLMTEQLLERGDRVFGTTRKPRDLAALTDRYNKDQFWVTQLEITEPEACHRVVQEAFGRWGRIDVVVSNAGYGLIGAAEELSDEQIRNVIDTNLLGSMRIIRAALPFLRGQGGGRILQVSASGGQISFPMFSAYHATKWGIEGFVESVAQEVAPFGIELTLVEPGGTQTGFSSAVVQAESMEVYEHTPVGDLRRTLSSTGFPLPGDARKVARAMIASVEQTPAPKRLAVGSDTYAQIHQALEARLAELESQKDIAFSVDLEPEQ